MPSSLRIAILGAGPVGMTLGQRWAEAGHTIAFGVKNLSPERVQSLRGEFAHQVFVGSPAATLEQSDIVLLAVPGNVVKDIIATHAQLLEQKIVIDATNQLIKGQTATTKQWQVQGPLNSLSTLQEYAPHAQVYRAFNSYSWEVFADPIYQGVQADLFYCGPDGTTQAIIEQLITEIGLNPVFLGGLNQIAVVDDILRLWAALALFQDKGRSNIALKVLTR